MYTASGHCALIAKRVFCFLVGVQVFLLVIIIIWRQPWARLLLEVKAPTREREDEFKDDDEESMFVVVVVVVVVVCVLLCVKEKRKRWVLGSEEDMIMRPYSSVVHQKEGKFQNSLQKTHSVSPLRPPPPPLLLLFL
jgi:hypothetical protein